ncbi:MAG: lysophospholipid acyltransferase family protein, partial [Beijerinckiaceae bacterium]
VIGAARPVSFVAKADVAGWPVFGTLARLQRTVFVDRTRRMATSEAARSMTARLADGGALVLFAEGTTNDGQRILPFRSALVGAAQAAVQQAQADGVQINGVQADGEAADPAGGRLQALTIAYVSQSGLPLSRADLPGIAWHGDMELPPHLMARLRGSPVEARLHWGREYVIGRDGDRKTVTQAIEQEVRAAYAALRAGREPS